MITGWVPKFLRFRQSLRCRTGLLVNRESMRILWINWFAILGYWCVSADGDIRARVRWWTGATCPETTFRITGYSASRFFRFCIYVCTIVPLRIGLLNWPVCYSDHSPCILSWPCPACWTWTCGANTTIFLDCRFFLFLFFSISFSSFF